ncbi:alpha/beta hydrolase [Herbaspirillum seropedicae]|uniref:Lipase protein n=1 Tax=Herbaspirillum seropedicae (strain SmR1) TaxID=757424 RepID=D8IR08_HERSS|nr:alpha/beta hydrolase [Herbaspirillum seropedicae]ADJ65134.1 lipase protein [Herbaspirillum seropedicae SmR1]AKN67002.1 lipase [Herbaspirillum seropedicae]UMU22999.1 alpha/beta hydrolase [Herbaspirillum seropedicae]
MLHSGISISTDTRRVLCPVAECEAGYNLKAAFPDFPQVLQQWQQATAAIADTLLTESDISYGDAPLQRFDFYRAEGAQRPLLVFIHGGYWQGGDKRDIGFIAAPYVKAGISVAVINYSLAPQARIEDMVKEVQACLSTIAQQAERLGIDVDRISLMGHSAGGHLAAFVAAQPGRMPVQAVFAISGVFDLAPLIPTSLNKALTLDQVRADALSPVLQTGPAQTRVHTIIGELETLQFHLQAAVMANCWPQVVAHHVVPDTHHYTVLFPLADADSSVCRAVIAEMNSAGRR